MGLVDRIGSIEIGELRFIIFETDKPHLTPAPDPVSTIVYAAHRSDAVIVFVDDVYHLKHIHPSLGYLTLGEFKAE